jgi:hypothetical protein
VVAAASDVSESLDDIEDVRGKLQELAAEGRVDELIDLVVDLLVRVRKDNNDLAVQLKGALRQLYGRRSEKVSGAQLSLFDQLGKDVPASAQDALASTTQDEPVTQPPRKPRGLKGKQGRNSLPENLPREPDRQLVPADQRSCAECGAEKKTIGYLSSEILEFVPAHFKVIEQEREKIACPDCEAGAQIAESQKVMERGPLPARLSTRAAARARTRSRISPTSSRSCSAAGRSRASQSSCLNAGTPLARRKPPEPHTPGPVPGRASTLRSGAGPRRSTPSCALESCPRLLQQPAQRAHQMLGGRCRKHDDDRPTPLHAQTAWPARRSPPLAPRRHRMRPPLRLTSPALPLETASSAARARPLPAGGRIPRATPRCSATAPPAPAPALGCDEL